MKILFAALVLCLSVTSQFSFAECPLGDGEDTLTLHRVMYRFGRSTRVVNDIARKGAENVAAVTTKDLQLASAEIQMARDCVAAVIGNRVPELQPAKAKSMAEADKAALLERYYMHMVGFENVLTELQAVIDQALSGAPTTSDFQMMDQKENKLQELAVAAHADVG